ncbi:acetyltransferase (GNAT) family protein [Kribbella voronezhensis]|uniref:Acetyltransferase (GNAT) family protein n=1 Tax=Kribbella voronezhensis TaxID=2512212 RepID=A0A4R7TAP4_9ACTN|nr:GNAT family N-acetyltransferase [Kribbella voronezhensis]TDU89102.1 acetyltransferase (GNAT) family protein [Kribbella voronezhensis]
MDELVRRWQRGWGLCRGLPPARLLKQGEAQAGLQAELGLPGRAREIFTLSDDPGLVAELVTPTPETWVTVTTTRRADEVAAELTGLGFEVFAERKALMTIALADHPVAPARPEYAVELETAASQYGAVERVRVVDQAGVVAARGMVAVVGTDAVMHDIHTDPTHRRRGLGSVVMSTLSRRAAELGATTGLLMATADGVRLYERLGWLWRATMVTGRSGVSAPGPEGGDLRPVLASR